MHTHYNVYGLGFWIEKLSVSMVELRGIEPRTSWMQIKRSPSWAIAPYWSHVIKTIIPNHIWQGILLRRLDYLNK